GINLLNDGYKLEFAVEVCKAMMFLYEEGMEDLLLEDIGSVSDVVWAPEYISMRKRVTDKLKEIMKKYGADYEHIRKWGFAQQGSKWGFIQPGSSWSDASCAVKYYLLEQRKNMSFDFSNIYFFNNFSQEETRKRSEKFFSDSKIKPDAFFKSIILCKALAAIALNKLELPGIINHETNTCTIQRGMRRETLLKNPGYGAIAEGEIFRGLIKHGIADSVALGAPPRGFTKPFFCDVIEMELPFSRFHFVYFLSPEFCEDDAPKDKLISLKADFPSQHECLCDMSKIPLKLKRKAQF
ncbi:MAG: hypothetical protein LBI77_04060, partial [Puniceicoccales bacterium]|nr:hypothetical protein [Puniceicoccales bacterium]